MKTKDYYRKEIKRKLAKLLRQDWDHQRAMFAQTLGLSDSECFEFARCGEVVEEILHELDNPPVFSND